MPSKPNFLIYCILNPHDEPYCIIWVYPGRRSYNYLEEKNRRLFLSTCKHICGRLNLTFRASETIIRTADSRCLTYLSPSSLDELAVTRYLHRLMITFLFYLPFLLGFLIIAVYSERKIAAFIQNRLGPMEVGPKGILQTVADLLKMLQKEDVRASAVDKWPFLFAPLFIFTVIFGGFSVLPLTVGVSGAVLSPGLFFLLAIISLDVLGILMAGWASNNKYSLFGAMRAAAQIISYEIPLGLSVLGVVMIAQTLDLQEMSIRQGILSDQTIYLFGIKSWGIDLTQVGGFLTWQVFQVPVLWISFIIFFISGLAEANRAPFDLPEAESELIGGYHTEYSGFRWGIFMLSEYGMMLLIAFLGSILFFGGWNTPLPNMGTFLLADWTTGSIWGVFWLLSKSFVWIFLQMWVRWTYPRLRVDQLMSLSWKYLTPLAIILLFVCGIWRLWMV